MSDWSISGGKNSRGMRVASYDPDDPTCGGGTPAPPGPLGARKMQQGSATSGSQRVATISNNYNEKTMLLSSDDEYQ